MRTQGPALADVSPGEIARLVRVSYGLGGGAVPLHGEHDLNLLLEDADGNRHVIKLHRAGADAQELELQDAVLDHLRGFSLEVAVPELVRDLAGEPYALADVPGETPRRLRVLSWVDGTPWTDAVRGREGAVGSMTPRSATASATPSGVTIGSTTMRSLGRGVASVDRALRSFTHPAVRRPHPWNLLTAADEVEDHLRAAGEIDDPEYRATVSGVLRHLATDVRARLAALPGQPIHNDANNHNVLVDRDDLVCGLIDFGDLCWAPRVCGLAVACAYGLIDRPMADVAALVAGYHEVAPLRPAELDVLFDLIRARLALSACMAVRQRRDQPDNEYLLVSQDGVRAVLRRLAAESAELAHLRFRAACGYEPVPTARHVRNWLQRTETGPVCGHPLGEAALIDWSRDGGAARPYVTPAIGRYLEDRAVYAGDAFATEDLGERRTLHLGVDIFLPAGEPVLAPLDGIVHDTAWRPERGDWGGVVVLAHRTAGSTDLAGSGEDVPFYTLYGHLSRASVGALSPGTRIARGGVIASLGVEDENGGWPPHLHFQLLTTDLGRGCGIYGVATRSERELWESISPDPNLVLGLVRGVRTEPDRGRADLLDARRTSLSRALSLSYTEALTIVRADGARLYDEAGRAYLDLVNNVCHVGHAHPRVVGAAAEQMARVNTNTRYLHPLLVSYARRIAATCPDPLSVVFLVNSGSEANDLALRLARAHTGQRDVLVLDHAYHGNLTSLIDISPYKFDGPGGQGRPTHTHVCALPDTYRGPLRRGEQDVGVRYAKDVGRRLADVHAQGRGVAAFVAESFPGVAGQIELPTRYLASAYEQVRRAGGVCVADEVQVGFGRVGSHFWGFDVHGVVPDIVTAGKPIGNGHPLGAVITTPEIAHSFANGMEYFNTFGGNPASCAVGLAVLDVIVDERLQAHAASVGERLMAGLRGLATRHALIGDVRGRGLYIGVELVRDRATLEPAAREATLVCELARAYGVLLSTDGPYHNVLKIKPPLALTADDAEEFLQVLGSVL